MTTDFYAEIEDLQGQIAELTEQLGKLIKESGDSYTADVVTSNIYSMLGVNGYSNGYSGDVQRVLDRLENGDGDEDESYDDYDYDTDDSDDEIEYTPAPLTTEQTLVKVIFGETSPEFESVLPRESTYVMSDDAKAVATHFLKQGQKITAIIEVRKMDGNPSLRDAKAAVEKLQAELAAK